MRHVDADRMDVRDSRSQLPTAISALDQAFSALSGDWRKLLAGVIYIHQVIRPSENSGASPDDASSLTAEPGSDTSLEAAPIEAAAETSGYPAVEPTIRTGEEPIHCSGDPLGVSLLDFWRWSAADLLSHATRNALAAYIVSSALGLEDGVRTESGAAGVQLLHSELRIEVQSASYLQSWPQQEPPVIRFTIRSSSPVESGTNFLTVDLKRRADIYVFCLLAHEEAKTLDPLDVSQWEFYVLGSSILDAKFPLGRSIGLASLESLEDLPITYADLPDQLFKYVQSATVRG